MKTSHIPTEGKRPSNTSVVPMKSLSSRLRSLLAGLTLRDISWGRATALYSIILIGINHRLVVGGVAGIWDADIYYAPGYMLVADFIRAGRLLFWNPWMNAGSPDYADPQVGTFSPPLLLFGLLTGGTESGFRLYWLFIWWLSGFGILWLGRHLKTPAWGACIVALGFAFSGYFTGHASHTSFMHALSYLPLMIWRLDVALTSRRVRPAVEAGVLWGLSALAGYPGMVVICGLYAGLWGLGRYLCKESLDRTAGASQTGPPGESYNPTFAFLTMTLLVTFLVGSVVMSPSYLSFLFALEGYTDRSQPLARAFALGSNALHPGALSTFSSPYLAVLKLFGNDTLWSYTDVTTCSIYTGPIVAVLALLSLLVRPRDPWRWGIVALLLLSIGCSLAQTLPFRGWLYDLFLPSRYFRHAGIFRGCALFSAAVLALLALRGFNAGLQRPNDRFVRRFVLASVIVASLALIVYWTVISGVSHKGPRFKLANRHVWFMWAGACAIPLLGYKMAIERRKDVIPALLLILASADAYFNMTLSRHALFSDPTFVKEWRRLDQTRKSSLDLTESGFGRISKSLGRFKNLDNKNLPKKIPVFLSVTGMINRFHLDMASRPSLSAIALGHDRIWFSARVAEVAATDANYAAFVGRFEELGLPPLVLHPGNRPMKSTETGRPEPESTDDLKAVTYLPPIQKVRFQLLKYDPDELTLDAFCPADGWLLVTDRWAKGWRVTVNGTPTEIRCANFIFRAIPVKSGSNYIDFSYHPFGYPVLLIMSWGTILVTGLGRLLVR